MLYEECSKIDCEDLSSICLESEQIFLPENCCPICLKTCYVFDGKEVRLREMGERWQRDPCTTCECSRDQSNGNSEIILMEYVSVKE